MTQWFKIGGASSIAAGVLAVGLILNSQPLAADNNNNDDNSDESKIQQGLKIAPVPLNLKGKNRSWVAQGSYLVNAVGGCNDCHTWRKTGAGAPSNYEIGGDPFAGQVEKIYAAGYLGGGRDFGPFRSRNLTPDVTGKVAGGWAEFKQIMRTGADFDHYMGLPLLQVMPWPIYRNMTDNDLRAIYEYLSAVPCVEGTPGEVAGNPDGTGGPSRCH
jgi:hypothetical protein